MYSCPCRIALAVCFAPRVLSYIRDYGLCVCVLANIMCLASCVCLLCILYNDVCILDLTEVVIFAVYFDHNLGQLCKALRPGLKIEVSGITVGDLGLHATIRAGQLAPGNWPWVFVGWHYLSSTTRLMRPHLVHAFVVLLSMIIVICCITRRV